MPFFLPETNTKAALAPVQTPPILQHGPLSLFLLLAGLITAAGLAAFYDSIAVPATCWMNVYAPEDIASLQELAAYLANLRIPVPPNLSILEIVSQRIFGSPALVTVALYRVSMIGGYICALAFAYPSIPRLMAAFAASLLFLSAAALIHPGNAQVYDPIFPFFLMLSLLLTFPAANPRLSLCLRVAASAGAGFFLSMTELLRPFGLLLLPLWILGIWSRLGGQLRILLLAGVIPLAVFSGGWHGWQAIRHGQATISNHGGYNLMRSWVMIHWPQLEEERNNTALRPGRWNNLNTIEHSRNSSLLTRHVLKYILTHPNRSLMHLRGRLFQIISGPTDLYEYQPRHRVLRLYRIAVFCCSTLLFGGVLAILITAVIAPRSIPALIASPANLLILTSTALTGITAFGEYGEDARFVISLLPFFAFIPLARLPCGTHRVIGRALLIGGGALMLLAGGVDLATGNSFRMGIQQTFIAGMGITLLFYGSWIRGKKRRTGSALLAPSAHKQ